MSQQILDKIQLLCKEISRVEWSGILLYSVKGSIKDPKNMVIILQEIIPMHKGTSGYTEYKINEKKRDSSGYEDRMIDYFNENPHALEEDWKMGHIHSHHSMQVFFSGTDMEELEDNSPSYNYYLSLIVNNYMDFKAKVAYIATLKEEITADYNALDEEGKPYKVATSKLTVKKEKMYVLDCDIKTPEVIKPTVDKTFMKNLNEIITKAETKVKNVGKKVFGGFQQQQNRQKPWNPYLELNQKNFSHQHPKDLFSDENLKRQAKLSNPLVINTEASDIEIFIMQLCDESLTEKDLESTSVEDTLDFYIMQGPDEELVSSFLDSYVEKYATDFPEDIDDESFIEFTKKLILVLEELEDMYSFLPRLIMSLKSLIVNFKSNGATV